MKKKKKIQTKKPREGMKKIPSREIKHIFDVEYSMKLEQIDINAKKEFYTMESVPHLSIHPLIFLLWISHFSTLDILN